MLLVASIDLFHSLLFLFFVFQLAVVVSKVQVKLDCVLAGLRKQDNRTGMVLSSLTVLDCQRLAVD